MSFAGVGFSLLRWRRRLGRRKRRAAEGGSGIILVISDSETHLHLFTGFNMKREACQVIIITFELYTIQTVSKAASQNAVKNDMIRHHQHHK